jgi:REP element-mobilizing transposase RayT
MNTLAKFEPARFYHIYNRTNAGEDLFKDDENRRYFLKRLKHFSLGFFEIYAYSLLGNHFHVCISCHEREEVYDFLKEMDKRNLTSFQNKFVENPNSIESFHNLISHQFQRFFISYTAAFNRYTKRKGSLLCKPFRRALIKSDSKLSYVFYYIHHNARKHKLVKHSNQHKWNSYEEILNNSKIVNVDFVLKWFGGIKHFIEFHKKEHQPDQFDFDGD